MRGRLNCNLINSEEGDRQEIIDRWVAVEVASDEDDVSIMTRFLHTYEAVANLVEVLRQDNSQFVYADAIEKVFNTLCCLAAHKDCRDEFDFAVCVKQKLDYNRRREMRHGGKLA